MDIGDLEAYDSFKNDDSHKMTMQMLGSLSNISGRTLLSIDQLNKCSQN